MELSINVAEDAILEINGGKTKCMADRHDMVFEKADKFYRTAVPPQMTGIT